MTHIKSHFKFTKGQRNGIFLLIFIVILIQCIYTFVDFTSKEIEIDQTELAKFQNEIDSLKLVEIENSKPKIFPFNPNYITDYKGYTLGMSSDEIDRLLQYREQDKWINSSKQFQEVTKVSDSLLDEISPYTTLIGIVKDGKYVDRAYRGKHLGGVEEKDRITEYKPQIDPKNYNSIKLS